MNGNGVFFSFLCGCWIPFGNRNNKFVWDCNGWLSMEAPGLRDFYYRDFLFGGKTRSPYLLKLTEPFSKNKPKINKPYIIILLIILMQTNRKQTKQIIFP
jgi:hypothetical protein